MQNCSVCVCVCVFVKCRLNNLLYVGFFKGLQVEAISIYVSLECVQVLMCCGLNSVRFYN